MNFNLHPIFVHFPVALLTVYALMELVRWRKVNGQIYWFYVKACFLIIGGLGSLAALWTGDMAKSSVRAGDFHVSIPNFNQVVSTHENFADLSVAIFGLLAVSYLIVWLSHENFVKVFGSNLSLQKFWSKFSKIAHFIAESRLVIFLALAGLVCITITGGLGGVMVYGPTADPFFGAVYHLLFPGQ